MGRSDCCVSLIISSSSFWRRWIFALFAKRWWMTQIGKSRDYWSSPIPASRNFTLSKGENCGGWALRQAQYTTCRTPKPPFTKVLVTQEKHQDTTYLVIPALSRNPRHNPAKQKTRCPLSRAWQSKKRVIPALSRNPRHNPAKQKTRCPLSRAWQSKKRVIPALSRNLRHNPKILSDSSFRHVAQVREGDNHSFH